MAFSGRITPADAGKTSPTERTRRNAWDHPRGCGENIDNLPLLLDAVGSPPRMRGKPGYTDEAKKPLGITPADAGKTNGFYMPVAPA